MVRISSLAAVALGLAALVACGGTAPGTSDTSSSSSTPVTSSSTTQDLQEDVFVQASFGEVDILWVIDDTAAAASLRAELAANFPVFLDYFLGTGLDYHIGVVTTDMVDPAEAGRLQGAAGDLWLDPESTNPTEVFADMVEPVAGPDAPTAGRDAAHAALETLAATANAGFARPTAALVVITASTSDDASTAITLDAWSEWLELARGDAERTLHVSIGAPAGSAYDAVTDAVGGLTCPTVDPACLADAGIRATGLTRAFHLSRTPLPDTIVPTVVEDGIIYEWGPEDWTFDAASNEVRFVEYVPNPGSEVHVTYVPAP